MTPVISLLLLDADGLLLDYQHPVRVRHLAAAVGREPEAVTRVLAESGLESAYASGELDTARYLARLSDALGQHVDATLWTRTRAAASQPQQAVVQRLLALPASLPLAVLSNNGALIAEVITRQLPELLPRLQDRVLCSGMLAGRKPDPAVFLRALARLHVTPRQTLFVDDLFRNVRGAREAGLQAETAHDGRSLGQVFKRYRWSAGSAGPRPRSGARR